MFCPECGIVIAPGPLDQRHACHGGGTIHRPAALLPRLWRWLRDSWRREQGEDAIMALNHGLSGETIHSHHRETA